jgi:hypothetical protein
MFVFPVKNAEEYAAWLATPIGSIRPTNDRVPSPPPVVQQA